MFRIGLVQELVKPVYPCLTVFANPTFKIDPLLSKFIVRTDRWMICNDGIAWCLVLVGTVDRVGNRIK